MLRPTYHYSLAACLMNLGRRQEGLEEIEVAAKLDGEHPLLSKRAWERAESLRTAQQAQCGCRTSGL